MKKHNVVIRMGATRWDARVNTGEKTVDFDFRKMTEKERREFTKTFVRSFREQRIAA